MGGEGQELIAHEVHDADQTTGEVHEQEKQTDAAGEQRDVGIVTEGGRQTDDPQRAEDRADHRTESADHGDGDHADGRLDRERRDPELDEEPGEESTREAADRPRDRDAVSLARRERW